MSDLHGGNARSAPALLRTDMPEQMGRQIYKTSETNLQNKRSLTSFSAASTIERKLRAGKESEHEGAIA